MLSAAMSLTITAMRNECWSEVRTCLRRVVFPLPKKPDKRVTGIGSRDTVGGLLVSDLDIWRVLTAMTGYPMGE